MNLSIDKDKLFSLKASTLVELKCKFCNNIFTKKAVEIRRTFAPSNLILLGEIKMNFCSSTCFQKSRILKIEKHCSQCNNLTYKRPSELKSNKSGNFFCSKSCATTYNNAHKTKGTRRSKLEIWLEDKLTIQYPQLKILYCDKTTINSELDIYIPTLNLAFELNGIYHYKPIHGQDKLNKIQNNDYQKVQLCIEQNIELCIIDTSNHKYIKEHTCQKYLNIILDIINRKL